VAEVGPRFPDVLEQPWALTLWTYYQLAERNRIRALIERIDAVNDATLTAIAFNEPKKLADERENALSAAREKQAKDEKAEAEWRERAARLVAAIEGGGVLQDAVTGSHA